MRKIFYPLCLFLALGFTAMSCDDDLNNDDNGVDRVIESSFTVESIANGSVPGNRSFVNLYDGVAYNTATAVTNSSKVDFAYNYRGAGCNNCRFFENVKTMSTRTGYVDQFSTVTDSRIVNAEAEYGITVADFQNIRTNADIDLLFSEKNIQLSSTGHVTNRTTDVAMGKVFAFTDKNGKRGFFVIGDYVANVPATDPATLNMQVKIQR